MVPAAPSHPAAPARHRSRARAKVGILLTEVGIPTSLYTEVGFPTLLLLPILHRFRSWVSSRKPHCRASAEGLGATLQSVFFPGVGTGLPLQSWRGHRIATLNPGVGTGLPHSILTWAQDCPGVSQKTLEAQCCTALRPQTRRPDCAENTGSASVHTDALPDSPPGSLRRIREVKAKE